MCFDPDLAHAGDIPVEPRAVIDITDSGELGWAGLLPDGSLLLIPARDVDRAAGTATERLLRYAPGSTRADTLLHTVMHVVPTPLGDVAAAGSPRVTAASAAGRFAAGTGDRYVVDVHDNAAFTLGICAISM